MFFLTPLINRKFGIITFYQEKVMIERINRQFEVLAAERRRFDKIIRTFPLNTQMFSSYITTIQSVTFVASNIAQSFTEALSHSQIKLLSKSMVEIISQLVQKLQQQNLSITKLKCQKQSQTKKIKTQYCSLCQQSIHENNIKQAKVYLQQESKQNFHLAVEQVQRLANQPLFTPEENKEYDQKLYLHLAQKEKVLNINCRRMEEFVDVVNATLDDLSKLKEIKGREDGDNQHYMNNFATSNKLGDDVSKFLKQSFSQKVPPWIHKMFMRIMAWYLQQKRQKMKDIEIQTIPYESAESKELKQTIKQLQKLQKQKNDLMEQMKILKVYNKTLEQGNAENMSTITALNRLIKSKQNISMRETSRKGNKSGQDSMSKDITPPIEEIQNQHINSIEDEVYKLGRKRKQFTVFPNIKKNKSKDGTSKSLSKDIKDMQISEGQKKYSDNLGSEQNGVLLNSQKNQIIQQGQPQFQQNVGNNNNKNTQYSQKKQLRKQINEKESQKIITNKKVTHQIKPKGKNDANELQKETRSSIELKKNSQNKQLSKRNRQENNKLVKASLSKMFQMNESPYATKSGDQSARHLIQFVTNMKMEENQINKKAISKNVKENTAEKREKQKLNTSTQVKQRKHQNEVENIGKSKNQLLNIQTNQNFNKQNEIYCNQTIYSNEIAVLKKVSKDLKDQILQKKTFVSKKLTEVNLQNINFRKNKQSNQSLSQFQCTPNYQLDLPSRKKSDIQCENSIKISKIHGNQTKNRNSSYQKDQQTKQRDEKIRKSQNTYLAQRSKSNSYYNCLKSPQEIQPSLNSSIGIFQSSQTQRKLFDGLKNNKVLAEELSYEIFSSLFSKILQGQKKQHGSDLYRSSLSKSKRQKQYICSKFPSVYEDTAQSDDQQHKIVYRRLFLTKAAAYKYEQSMTKSYHKKKIKYLNEEEKNYCYEMFCSLTQAKKLEKSLYQQFCSMLRYPYQTLYNSFDVLNFVSDMSYETFEHFFRKIAWIHRKCQKQQNLCVCQHIQSMRMQLQIAAKQGTVS